MKQPERVAELLAELRALTETDFERHRIDVLERDLTAPPVVEVVDDTHQKFDGMIYRKNPKNKRYFRSGEIHRAVWLYCYGEIPDGYQIHHIDENIANNDISNLQCLTKEEHQRLHSLTVHQHTCVFCGEKFLSSALTKTVKFCSEKCHSAYHARRSRETRICVVCGKEFSAYKYFPTKTCSLSCRGKLIWQKRDKPSKEKKCAVCGKPFITGSHPEKKTCSEECARKLCSQTRKKPPVEKICPVCGKPFTPYKNRSTQECCSLSCSAKLRWQRSGANK
ncbi:MAG: HNH endonuclease [Selenomonadaceae bacterium]|nr:HNH endonuclease [Selenomonadaceae bacterium]